MKGRVIHVNPSTKQIGLSLLKELLEFPEDVNNTEYNIGSFVEECKVVKCKYYEGIYLTMPNNAQGFVHVSIFNAGVRFSFEIKNTNSWLFWSFFCHSVGLCIVWVRPWTLGNSKISKLLISTKKLKMAFSGFT